MADSFKLKVLTPAGVALECEVSEVYLPASQGEIGILPHHTKYTGLLGTGILSYVESGHTLAKKIVISEGFCNFSENILTVLTDTVDIAEKVDRESLKRQKEEARVGFEALSPTDPNWKSSRARLERFDAVEKLLHTHS